MSTIKKKICYIIGSCKECCKDLYFNKTEKDLIIAADGGYDILKSVSIKPDLLLGDFDSIENIPSDISIIRHPKEKDDTDTFLAYKYAFEKGYKSFIIFGGIGGRLDHTVANIQTLANIALCGGRGFLIGNNEIITSVYNSKIAFSPSLKGNISVFAQNSIAKNVSISGLKYNIENCALSPQVPLGVSNEFVGDRAEVSVKDGIITIIWQEKTKEFLLNLEEYFL